MTPHMKSMAYYMMKDGVTDGRIAEVLGVPVGRILALSQPRVAAATLKRALTAEDRAKRLKLNRAQRYREKTERERIKRELLR